MSSEANLWSDKAFLKIYPLTGGSHIMTKHVLVDHDCRLGYGSNLNDEKAITQRDSMP